MMRTNWPYISIYDLQAFANINENDAKFNAIPNSIIAASQEVNKICNRRFDLVHESRSFFTSQLDRIFNLGFPSLNDKTLDVKDFITDDFELTRTVEIDSNGKIQGENPIGDDTAYEFPDYVFGSLVVETKNGFVKDWEIVIDDTINSDNYVPFVRDGGCFINQPFDSLGFINLDLLKLSTVELPQIPNMRITANWGWPYIPESVKEATKLLAHRYIVRFNHPYGPPESGTQGNIATTIQTGGSGNISALVGREPKVDYDVLELLDPYRYKGFI